MAYSLTSVTNNLNRYWLNLPLGTAAGVLRSVRVKVKRVLVTEATTIFSILCEIKVQDVAEFVALPVTLKSHLEVTMVLDRVIHEA